MDKFNFTINGNKYDTEILEIDDTKAQISVNGVTYDVEIDNTAAKKKPTIVTHVVKPTMTSTSSQPVQHQAQRAAASDNAITAPLPGVILDVKVNVGDAVTAGQHLVTLEAMKMENSIDAPKNGTIKSIAKHKGDSVMEGDVLIVIE